MYKFYQTAPVLRGLLFLSTPISAEDAKTPVAKCVESCAEVAEELARQERPFG